MIFKCSPLTAYAIGPLSRAMLQEAAKIDYKLTGPSVLMHPKGDEKHKHLYIPFIQSGSLTATQSTPVNPRSKVRGPSSNKLELILHPLNEIDSFPSTSNLDFLRLGYE